MGVFRSKDNSTRSEERILQHAAALHEQGRYDELVRYYEQLAPSRITARIAADWARAYANLAVETSTERGNLGSTARFYLSRAVELMEFANADDAQADISNEYFLGKSLALLDMPNKALPHVRSYAKARPDDAEATALLEYCSSTLAAPLGVEPFVTRAKAAWERFAACEGQLRALIAAQRDDEAYRLADETLIEGVEFMLVQRYDSGRFELVLSCGHWKVDLYKIAYFKALAPESVTRHWDVLLGWQACDDAQYALPGMTLFADDVLVWPQYFEDNGTVRLQAWSKGLARVLSKDSALAYDAFMNLADETIGEVRLMRCLDGVELLEEPLAQEATNLQELRASLDERLGASYEGPLDSVEGCLDDYFCVPGLPVIDPTDPAHDVGTRQDVLYLSTSCPDLLDEFMAGESSQFDNSLADGVVCGYFFWPNDISADIDPAYAIEYFVDLSASVEDALCAEADDTVATIIGGALGTTCCYLDFIAWDFPTLVQAARRVFQSFANIDVAAYRSFLPGVAAYALKGSYSS